VLAERSRALSGALATITDDQRTAIVLYDIEGYDYAEIAEMTGVSLGTVKSRIHRGRLALRNRLEGRMELFRG
jgi:RNA polymerase sigma-70 factor (ECF subfamily)